MTICSPVSSAAQSPPSSCCGAITSSRSAAHVAAQFATAPTANVQLTGASPAASEPADAEPTCHETSDSHAPPATFIV